MVVLWYGEYTESSPAQSRRADRSRWCSQGHEEKFLLTKGFFCPEMVIACLGQMHVIDKIIFIKHYSSHVMASCVSGKKGVNCKDKGRTRGKKEEKQCHWWGFGLQICVAGYDYCSNSYSENTLHFFCWLFIFLITGKLVMACRIRSCFLSHSRHSCLDHRAIKLSKGSIIGCNHLSNIFTTPDWPQIYI